jgi:MFS family permease
VFGPYVQVLRRPGAAKFSAAGLLARMQMSMSGVGAVLFVSAERGSYAVAGIASAVFSIACAVVGPQLSRLIDAHGQRKVVPIQLAVHVPAILGIILVGLTTSLNWPIYLLAGIAGAAAPNIGPLVRARWSNQLSGSPQLRTAFAWESLLDEVVFIVGPPLATVLALQLFPSAALIAASVFLMVGSALLLMQRSTEPPVVRRGGARSGPPALLLPGVAGIAAIFVLVGGVFGTWEVSTVAFAQEQGHPGMAGLLLALYSFGSLSGGLIFGVLELRVSLAVQYVFAACAMGVITLPIPFLDSLLALGVGAVVAGFAVAPVLISGMALVERIVPAGRLTESMTWASSGLSVGLAVSMPLAGIIVDHQGASTAYLLMSASAVGAAAMALLLLATLRRAQHDAALLDPDAMDEPLLPEVIGLTATGTGRAAG